MRFTIAVLTTLLAVVTAMPVSLGRTFPMTVVLSGTVSLMLLSPQQKNEVRQNDAREQFKEENCKSQACIDAVDSGCPLSNINFSLGCDENGPGQ